VDYSSKAKTDKSTNVRDFLAAKNTVRGATRVDPQHLEPHDGHDGPPPGLPMPARPRQTGHSPHPCPLLATLISAGTRARAPATAEPICPEPPRQRPQRRLTCRSTGARATSWPIGPMHPARVPEMIPLQQGWNPT